MSIELLKDIPHLKDMLGLPYDVLKAELVSGGAKPGNSKVKKSDLDEFLAALAEEFNGRSRLEFFHTVLIVLIRRRIMLQAAKDMFFDLWENETDFLCKHLSLRWLVSACDTICDHPRSPAEATTAIAASMLINTFKLYETERLTFESLNISERRMAALQGTREDLFDGLTTFKIGRGDMIRNLAGRLKRTRDADAALVARIFYTAVERVFTDETVFLRFRRLHNHDATRW
ncbi:hypothetical protein [Candidatus Nitrotoga sp. 1052]|uniref:hypothetical protein n=1 Tax=Candidatus Nitrotoga sp. 1052 TaxID=2886964 RepID=UPI001EF5E042|nr:hypothetical protein [Candidatus Nitrotoga sp. 1052]